MTKALKPRANITRPSPDAVLAIAQQAAPGQPPATVATEERPTTLKWTQPRTHSFTDDPDTPSGDPTDHTRVLSVLEAAVAALRDRAETAEQRAEAAEQARNAEHSRAEQALQAGDAERRRADALRMRIDELLAQLAAAEAEANQARAQAQDATQVLDAMTVDTAARKARGLMARLRAALRGD